MLESVLGHIPISFHLFGLFATITIAGACGVAFSRNIVYSAFSLLGCFAGMVGLFAMMSADFLAIVQLMVYVGGILVLILFAVMLTNRISDIQTSNPSNNVAFGVGLLMMTMVALFATVLGHQWNVRAELAPFAPTAQAIGSAFLGRYLLGFEIAGVILLVALLAAVVIARKEVKDVNGEMQ